MSSLHRLALILLLILGFLLPATSLVGPTFDPTSAWAEDEEEPAEDDDDPFGDGGDDFFDSPTTFSREQADKAIQKGAAWLKKQQGDDGSWGEVFGNAVYGGGQAQGGQGAHPAGPTALAIYALLKCKASLRDPVIRKGMDFLRKRHELPKGSYETSMMLLAICATADPYKTSRATVRNERKLKLKGRYRKWAQDLQRHLLDKKSGQGWRYNVTGQPAPHGGPRDLSSTQLAALGLFAAHRLRIRAPNDVWEDILAYSMAQQDTDGPEVVTKDPLTQAEIRRKSRGFAYIKGMEHPEEGKATGAMTACGIANIMMARFVLTDGGRSREAWDARPDAAKVQSSIEDGLTWLAENWSPNTNPGKKEMNVYHIYWMYAVERAMDLVGKQKIGSHLWYSEMGQSLISSQREDGSWDSQSAHKPSAVLDTCFALLFLKKATEGQIPFPSITGGSDEPPVDNR